MRRFSFQFKISNVKYLSILLLLASSTAGFAQNNNKKKAEAFPFAYATTSFQQPGGDMADRFGNSWDIGGGLGYKLSSNFIFGVESTYIFGENVKQNTLEGLLNQFDQITNIYGDVSEITMRQAGFQVKVTAGKILPVFGSNANSGFFIRGGLGLLQHKIYIENIHNNTPQVLDAYRKGYDRLCNGLMMSEFVGWQNFGTNTAYHFMLGFELSQAWTQNRRSWDYATNQKIDDSRLDLLYTVKFAYFIPFLKHDVTNYFYY